MTPNAGDKLKKSSRRRSIFHRRSKPLRVRGVRGRHRSQRDVESLLSQYDSAGELLDEPVYGNTEMSALESFVEEKIR